MCLTMMGNDFFFYQQAKNRVGRSKIDTKIDTFGHIGTRVLATLGVSKSRFSNFFKVVLRLFKMYLGTVFVLKKS